MSGSRTAVPRRLLAVLILAVLASLAATVGAADAQASSVVYIADGNVWLTTPDGSRQRQLTTDGTDASPYASPSMADDGTILALKSKHFVRMRPDGTRIGDPVPGLGSTVETSGNLFLPSGPLEPMISPNGQWIAYWFTTMAHTCRTWWDCSYEIRDRITWSRADRFTNFTDVGLITDYRQPSWIDDEHLLAFNYGLAPETVVTIDGPGAEQPTHPWFSDRSGQGRQISKGQLARTLDRMAVLVGSNRVGSAQEELYLVHLPQGPGGPPRAVCYFHSAAPPAELFGWPVWSPDGTALAWVESDGIHMADIPDLGAPDLDCATITRRSLVRGSEPFWGAADVPAEAGAEAAAIASRRGVRARSEGHFRAVGRRERRQFAAAVRASSRRATSSPAFQPGARPLAGG